MVCVNPLACSEELTGPLCGFRSYHHEEYRVIFKVFPELNQIAVVGVSKKNADHYAEIYKQLESIATAGKLADGFLSNLRMFSSH